MSDSDSCLPKKCRYYSCVCCLICSIFVFIAVLIFYIYIQDYNMLPPIIGYPEENTENHTFGHCYLYDNCEVNNGTLVAFKKYKLPTQYKTDVDGSNCPTYREETSIPTYYYMKNECTDLGYGCCTLPIDTICEIRTHFIYRTSISRASWLYERQHKNYQPRYLDIPKEDINGTNCPVFEKLEEVPLWKSSEIVRNTRLILDIIGLYIIIYIMFFCCRYMIDNNKDYSQINP